MAQFVDAFTDHRFGLTDAKDFIELLITQDHFVLLGELAHVFAVLANVDFAIL